MANILTDLQMSSNFYQLNINSLIFNEIILHTIFLLDKCTFSYIFADMKLTKIAKIAINGEPVVRNYIMSHYNISRQTLHNWRKFNDKRLADDSVLRFIARHLEVDKSLLIE